MEKYILVTGAAGFIGSHTVEELNKRGYSVVGIDCFDPYYPKWIKERNLEAISHKNFLFQEGDFTNTNFLNDLFSKYSFSHVIHLGAIAGVRNSIINPLEYIHLNVHGTTALLETCKKYDVDKIVIASSSSVYGGRSDVPFRETDAINKPISPYASSKAMTESIAYAYHSLYNFHISLLRFFTVYGPRGRPDMAPYLFMNRITRGETIYQFGDGSTGRDYTYISDIVAGIIASMESIDKWGYEIFNLGNSSPILLSEFIETIEEVVDKKAIREIKPLPPGDVPITYADISKAQELLNYSPRITIKAGLEKTFEWYNTLDRIYNV
jgi:UDP-glucuronate 4-epimerase